MKLALGTTSNVDDADQLAGTLRSLLRSSEPLVELDVSALQFVDVTFFQLLLAFRASLEKGGRRLVLSPSKPPMSVLESGRRLGLPLELLFDFTEEEK